MCYTQMVKTKNVSSSCCSSSTTTATPTVRNGLSDQHIVGGKIQQKKQNKGLCGVGHSVCLKKKRSLAHVLDISSETLVNTINILLLLW
jgi:hypothetical protein